MCLRANADCTANWRPPPKYVTRRKNLWVLADCLLYRRKRSLEPRPLSEDASRHPRRSRRISTPGIDTRPSPRPSPGSGSVHSSWATPQRPESHNNDASSPKTGDFRTPAAVSDLVEGNSALAITRTVPKITDKDS